MAFLLAAVFGCHNPVASDKIAAPTPAANKDEVPVPVRDKAVVSDKKHVFSLGPSKAEISAFVHLLQECSYDRESVSAGNWTEVIKLFLEKLDPEHVYFTQADADTLSSTYGATLAEDLQQRGSVASGYAIYDLYKTRVSERTICLQKQTANWAAVSTDDISFPRPGNAWVLDQQSLDKIWSQRLRYEWAKVVVQGGDVNAADYLSKHHESFCRNVASRSEGEIAELFLNSLATLYDGRGRSRYYSGQTYNRFSEAMKLETVAIGVLLNEEGPTCTILSVTPGGSAAQSGRIHTGDHLVSVEQPDYDTVDVAGLTSQQVADILRGSEGTQVTLVIEHPYSLEKETVNLTRKRAELDRTRALLYRVPTLSGMEFRLGVISLPALYGKIREDVDTSATEDVRAFLQQLEGLGADGVALDLRGNGGGLMTESIEVAGLFVGDQPVLQTKDISHQFRIHRAEKTDTPYRKPMVVLVDSETASGAEIIAGALQDYHRAIVIGSKPTAGVGSIQTIIELGKVSPSLLHAGENPGAAKLTVQQFYLPNGSSTEQHGIKPDVLLPELSFATQTKANIQHSRLKTDNVASLPLPLARGAFKQLPTLRADSERRQAELPEITCQVRLSGELAKYHPAPSGNLVDFRKWVDGRIALEKAYETQRGHIFECAYSADELRLPNETVGPSQADHSTLNEKKPGEMFDASLQESLRILADLIQLDRAAIE